ncbi:MAG: 2-amino-4-hydroxy-6-hydroxymethyldihydropteridine diphosphokinase, partial [Dolichospermum sp.]
MIDKSDLKTTIKPSLSAIALGSNMGESLAILEGAIKSLEKTPGITIKAKSSWYRTAPVGGPSQPDY